MRNCLVLLVLFVCVAFGDEFTLSQDSVKVPELKLIRATIQTPDDSQIFKDELQELLTRIKSEKSPSKRIDLQQRIDLLKKSLSI